MGSAFPKYHHHFVRWGNGTGTHAYLLNLVGFNKKVLEIGCSTGSLSRVMQQRGCQITGVEIDEAMADMARPFCRRMILGDAEELDWEAVLGGERFDVITFGDVLEHMRAPEVVLRQLRGYLTPTGYVVVSLPNIAHGSVRLSLLLGRFEYDPLGILDESHLRFYTKGTAQQLLISSGFQVKEVKAAYEPIPTQLTSEVLSRFSHVGPDWIEDLLSQEDAQAVQYVFRAEPAGRTDLSPRACQVEPVSTLSVVVSHRGNDGAKLLRCLQALSAQDTPFERIVVVAESNPALPASEGESLAIEWNWQARQPDEGDARALNRALTAVSGDVVLVLDSGSLLRAGTLAALVHRFRADSTAGVIGGKVLDSDGRAILQAGAYLSPPVARIADRGAGHRASEEQWDNVVEVDFVPASMMALRYSLWRSLNGFDEGYLDHYVGADFCARAWAEGYRVLVEPNVLAISPFSTDYSLDTFVGLHRDRLRFVCQHYGKGTWPEGFFEAESALLDETDAGLERQALRLAYLWRLAGREGMRLAEIQPFLDLHQQAKALERADASLPAPRLRAHRFSSTVPLVGGLIAYLRGLWGRIAARWYSESLIRQQNAFNQQLCDRAENMLEELSELERLVIWLGTELADLRRKRDQAARKRRRFADSDEG